MKNIKLSKKGNELIRLYEEMAEKGVKRTDGAVNNYNDFQLRKFRYMCKNLMSRDNIKTVLDYGGGGSDWDKPGFESGTKLSAKDFFQIQEVHKFEPARGSMEKKEVDCVVCIDVLEHIFISDIPKVVEELFSLAKKLLVVNVACYKAAALLPNGENAHITVRDPNWWKGVFDTIASKYEDIEFMLICSENFHKGKVFDSIKFSEWDSVKGYTTDADFKVFKPK